LHTVFAVTIGRLYALAPDEGGYLYTFNNLYDSSDDPNPQYNSGWITSPKIFLWIVYLPSKILTILGMPDYLAIRFLSIFLGMFSLYLLQSNLMNNAKPKFQDKVVLLSFIIPSIFLWTTVGLRESFIVAELTIILVGVKLVMKNGINTKGNFKGFAFILIGSYGLLSTKPYLWICLILAFLLSSIIYLFLGFSGKKTLSILITLLIIPSILFVSTTSSYALSFILKSDISEAGKRSGDSLTKISVDDSGKAIGINSNGEPTKDVKTVTFHGDYTLVALHFYFKENPNSIFTKILSTIKVKDKIETIWDEKLQLGLIYSSSEVGRDTSSLNGHILTPGQIDKPLSMIWPAIVFLCGPFPFIGDGGIAATIASLESPLWWLLYSLLMYRIARAWRSRPWTDPQCIFTFILLTGFIAFSALVEVNLGTSFRHRSILLIPILILYSRLGEVIESRNNKA
jgi:hypothetical protein